MATPRVLVLRAPGTNCDVETTYAFEQAGGKTEAVHVNRLLENPNLLSDYQILCLPGGFSFGDDVSAGRILGNLIRHHLAEQMQEFRDAGKLILGICNGFQILMKTGMLAAEDRQGPQATLAWNKSGKFEDRWVQLGVAGNKCEFLKGIEQMYLPVAHAEGNFCTRDAETLGKLDGAGQLTLRYLPLGANEFSQDYLGPIQNVPTVKYPEMPNGATGNIAGMCDPSGRVFGLMPHPERFITRTQHPRWTREELPEIGAGLQLFKNGISFFA